MTKSPAGRSPQGYILPDVLEKGLKVVICGWAAGQDSDDAKEYYKNTNNKFWELLETAKLTTRKLCSHEFETLPKEHGIGLTDVCKFHSGKPHNPPPSDDDLRELVAKIKCCKPHILAFNGKGLAQTVLKLHFSIPEGRVHYRLQEEITIGESRVWVLPDSSGGNRHWGTHENEYKGHWRALGTYIRQTLV